MTLDLNFSLLLNVWLGVNDLIIWAGKNRLGQLIMLIAADSSIWDLRCSFLNAKVLLRKSKNIGSSALHCKIAILKQILAIYYV